jgi:hypothetical protein
MVYAGRRDSVCDEPEKDSYRRPAHQAFGEPPFGSLRLHMIALTENGLEILVTV